MILIRVSRSHEVKEIETPVVCNFGSNFVDINIQGSLMMFDDHVYGKYHLTKISHIFSRPWPLRNSSADLHQYQSPILQKQLITSMRVLIQ